jgi:CPA1 family monovalent cation:H+ antiporter
MGWYTPQLTTVRTRLTGVAFWEILVFVVNALLFVLVGLQLRGIIDRIGGQSTASLLGDAAIVCLAVMAIRIVWVPVFTYLPLGLVPRLRERDPEPPWTRAALVSWTGMRGAISLAAALALPTDVPGRDLIVFLTFAVILATLVGQGLSLPLVIRALRIEDDGAESREEAKARIKAADAAIARLEELVGEDWVREDTAERLRGLYEFRRSRFRARLDGQDEEGIEERSARYQVLRRELLEAERRAVLELRRTGVINDDVMRRVQRDLDLEDSRLDI